MPVTLSVIIPVHNERYLVAESVHRVLSLNHPTISELDVVVVDDGSTDGTRAVLRRLASRHPDRVTYLEHEKNRGKGAAVATGVEHARGDITVVHDADLEYDPEDLPRMMTPFVRYGADVVYGSRFMSSNYRRVLHHRHALGNWLITQASNLLTDLNLTDVETSYKAIRTSLLRSIPLRSQDFRIEVELTFKLKKRGARIFEVPISYAGRTYEEGKKFTWRDGVRALSAMIRWSLVDDLYRPDQYGSNILVSMSEVPRFNRWMSDRIRPFVGDRVLEIGAGLGNISRTLIPRDRYTASDINPHYLAYLESFAERKPYLDVRELDLTDSESFEDIAGEYDTVICLNVLEHVRAATQALSNIRAALAPGGKAIILVPRSPRLFGTLDEVLGHERRYSRESLQRDLTASGFEVKSLTHFNRITTPMWWINGRLLKRRHFGRVQLKVVNHLTWAFRILDHVLPWGGVSLIAVAQVPASGGSTESGEQELQPSHSSRGTVR